MNENNKTSKLIMFKRVVALCGAAILALLLLATLIVGCLSFEGSQQVFMALVGCDIILPVIIWGYMVLVKWASKKDDEIQN